MSFVEEILCQARRAGASDVHLIPGAPPGMRVNGGLLFMDHPPVLPADTLDILIHVMSEAQREKLEERGEYDFAVRFSECGRCRVNAYRQSGSMALAIRLVRERIPTLKELGLPEAVAGLCRKKKGLVLVAGPSGSGKTATLAAMVNEINENRAAHIITLERPIEYLHPHKLSMTDQREVGVDCGDYVSALRAALRQDPDVILVGELEDAETVNAAMMAAETGHLVLSAFPAAGAGDALTRIVGLFPCQCQQQMRGRLANILEAVIFQQLTATPDGKGQKAVFKIIGGNNA